jgi:hypothetical protein
VSVRAIQQSLEKALSRARLQDDRELMGRVREDGLRLVQLLHGLVRAVRLYPGDNEALRASAGELSLAVLRLIDLLGDVRIVCVEGQVYLNEVRLRAPRLQEEACEQLARILGGHDVGGITFHGPADDQALRALARALDAPPGPGHAARAVLQARLASLFMVELVGRHRFRVSGESAAAHLTHSHVLRRGAAALKSAVRELAGGHLPNPLPVRRAVIELVDSLKQDAERAAVASLRPRAWGAGEHHLLGVASLALLVGLDVGLTDAALSDLGVAAMLHDVGWARLPDREGHTRAGLRMLMRQRGFHEGKVRRLQAVLEHHFGFDRRQGLFARIIRIADDYDVLVAPRAGQPQVPPSTAQAAMWAARGSVYDPDLLALFVRRLGLYPPGSLLELSDGSWVVAISGGRDPERFAWPVVRVIRDADGQNLSGRDELDLFAHKARFRVKRIVNPQTSGVDVGDVLAAAFGPENV